MSADGAKMFPLMLDVTALPVMLIGGEGLLARMSAMDDFGATAVHVFSANPPAALIEAAGSRLTNRLPETSDFTRIAPRIVFISDFQPEAASVFRAQAHAVGALVHVQDQIPLCDFHLPAILRRGRLQVTVSTDGAAAGLARILRDHVGAHVFGPEWAGRVEEMAQARTNWKREGMTLSDLAKAVSGFITDRGWLGK